MVEPEHLGLTIFLRLMSFGLVLSVALRWELQPIPVHRTHHFACILTALVFTFAATEYWVLQDVYFDLSVQLLSCCLCLTWLRPRWVALGLPFLLGAWLAVRVPGAFGWPTWDEGLLMLAALTIAVPSYLLRYRVSVEQWSLQVEELTQQHDLNEALSHLASIEERLEAEMELRAQGLARAIEGLATARSEESELHQSLLRANRLQALGRLSTSLAHRLNNLTTVVVGSLDCLGEALQKPDCQILVSEIKAAAAQGASLTSKLLSLTARQNLNMQVLTLEELLTDRLPLLAHLVSPGVGWDVKLRDSDARIEVDPEAWMQVMSNLIRNADQANSGTGEIEFRVERVDDQVSFTVLDQGPGIPPELRTRVFEPFFSTRTSEGGTGLGLSIVFGLVEQMNARVDHKNRPQGGSLFVVSFPLWSDQGAASKQGGV